MIGITLASVAGVQPAAVDDWAASMSSFTSPSAVAVMASSQLLSLGIVWLAAGRAGLRRETLRLADPKPAWSTAVGAGILLIVVSGAVELILYNLLGFELFGDTKWLMEGLNSHWAGLSPS